ncbi:hypothetical protein [Streptomyces sp. NPDC093970]|uniref:hypothetical protein n=1 Tax=Streptomyces sp. NPDC093970 TaxID=3155076 RepID=UPI00343FBE91
MAETELKRYTIKPDSWEEFLDTWRRIVRVRRRHGFGVLFAFADRDQGVFTWAINHEDDFDQAAAAYYADPERKQLEVVENYVTQYEIRKVAQLQIPE